MIGIGLLQALQKRIHRILRAVAARKNSANSPDERRFLLIEQQVFTTRTRSDRINSWEDTTVRQRAIELHFHIAGTLELFEDNLVHLRARIDQSRSQNGKTATAFDVTCSTQEFLGWIECC